MPGGQVPGHRPDRPVQGTAAEGLDQDVDALLDGGVRLASLDLVRPHLVLERLQEIGTEDGPQRSQGQRQVQLEAIAFRRPLVHVVLGHQEHAEALQAQVLEGQLVALVVLAEAAGSARARGQVDVALRDFLGSDLARFSPQEVGQVPGHEAGGAALSDVRQLPPGQQVLLGRGRQDARSVSPILQDGGQHLFEAPVETAEQDGRRAPFGLGERARAVCAVVLDCAHGILPGYTGSGGRGVIGHGDRSEQGRAARRRAGTAAMKIATSTVIAPSVAGPPEPRIWAHDGAGAS